MNRNSITFTGIIERIKRRIRIDKSWGIGVLRENLTKKILEELKRERKIKDFLQTSRLSWADVIEGVDFYVVVVKNRYEVIPLSITGLGWVKKHLNKHPDKPVIPIDIRTPATELEDTIRKNILNIIENYPKTAVS